MRLHRTIDAFASRLANAGVPIRHEDNSAALSALQARLPRRLSPSFESLLARYSFPKFDVCGISVFAWNSNWSHTDYFVAASGKSNPMSESLLPAGFMQIGRPDTGDFDAICLDLNSKGEQRLVRIDHEEILCNNRIRVVAELWPSFAKLVDHVLSGAECGIYFEEPDPEQ